MKMIDMNFELKELEKIGKGTFGRVIKCFDKKSWKFYAMKIERIEIDRNKLALIMKKIDRLMDEISVH